MRRKYVFLIILVSILLIAFTLFTPVDRTPLEETEHYRSTLHTINELDFSPPSDTVRVGWSKRNITPSYDPPLAGYGARRPKKSQGLLDSIYVRCLWMENSHAKAVIFGADLLIFPPEIRKRLLEKASEFGLNEHNFYFTATHTHSSTGGWVKGLTGRLIAGKYDENLTKAITDKCMEALKEAQQEQSEADISFAKLELPPMFSNRIVGNRGIINPWLKIITITTRDGLKVILPSYAAHPTCYGSDNMLLSGDYPGKLQQLMDADSSIGFSMFMAGPMGSMGHPSLLAEPTRNIDSTAKVIYNAILNTSETKPVPMTQLSRAHIPVQLGEPQLRISENIRIRPWLFHLLVGEPAPYISTIRINDILMVSTPCDFSGEIAFELDSIISQQNDHLVINSFNGSYIGYITKDEWYDLKTYETRDMNWFGPYNGQYFKEIILGVSDSF